MKLWQKILIPTLITLAIGVTYLFYVWKQRQNPGVIGQADASQQVSQDDVAVVRMEFQQHYEDTLDLVGKPLWMKNGYTIPYYPFAGGRVEFAKRVGLIPAAQRLDVKKIVKAATPASEHDGMEHGAKQVFAVFALPGGTDLFATPLGFIDGSQEAYYCDILYYYDDPHKIYDHWPKGIWAAIDAHQVKPGMSELQTRMSIGQNAHPDGQTEGERTVTYDVNGKHYAITYVKNKATQIKSE
jgi:hypothetical protein